jgi:hypothetical protein
MERLSVPELKLLGISNNELWKKNRKLYGYRHGESFEQFYVRKHGYAPSEHEAEINKRELTKHERIKLIDDLGFRFNQLSSRINFQEIENEKNNYYQREHEKLRLKNVFLSILPYKQEIDGKIVKMISDKKYYGNTNAIFYKAFKVSERGHVYFLPESCTIFVVMQIHDYLGLFSRRLETHKPGILSEIVYNLNNIEYTPIHHKERVKLNLFKKYLCTLIVKDKKIIKIFVNPRSGESLDKYEALSAELNMIKGILLKKDPIIFNEFMLGFGEGIIYDIIVYKWILKDEEILKISDFLIKIHQIFI